jgi:cation diffusion facilitator CzcD-associated flavoprotein CzcO
MDNKYLKALHSPKICLTRDTISSVGRNKIVTQSGEEYLADVLVRLIASRFSLGERCVADRTQVFATGFEFTQWQAESVFGRGGVSLKQHWGLFGGIEAYKTVAMSEFPNLFYLLGPNSGSGHTSVLYSIEW